MEGHLEKAGNSLIEAEYQSNRILTEQGKETVKPSGILDNQGIRKVMCTC